MQSGRVDRSGAEHIGEPDEQKRHKQGKKETDHHVLDKSRAKFIHFSSPDRRVKTYPFN